MKLRQFRGLEHVDILESCFIIAKKYLTHIISNLSDATV